MTMLSNATLISADIVRRLRLVYPHGLKRLSETAAVERNMEDGTYRRELEMLAGFARDDFSWASRLDRLTLESLIEDAAGTR